MTGRRRHMITLTPYTTNDGQSRIPLRTNGGTVRLSPLEMADLFQTSERNVATHLKAIVADGELSAASVVNY